MRLPARPSLLLAAGPASPEGVVGQLLAPADHRPAGCLSAHQPDGTGLDQYPGTTAAADGVAVEPLPRDGVATNHTPPLPSPLA